MPARFRRTRPPVPFSPPEAGAEDYRRRSRGYDGHARRGASSTHGASLLQGTLGRAEPDHRESQRSHAEDRNRPQVLAAAAAVAAEMRVVYNQSRRAGVT